MNNDDMVKKGLQGSAKNAEEAKEKAAPVIPIPAPAPAPAKNSDTYTAKKGDTLLSIANSRGLSLGELKRLNKSKKPLEPLDLGEQIKLK